MLLFIDNIFRFVQAGSEVSALLGRMPSQVGYQPTLESEMGQLQERITSTRKGSVTSIQAIYVPADDLTDPAPASVFAHLNATTTLSRAISEKGIYPAVDPLDSTSTILKPEIVGEEHFNVANEVKAGAAALPRAAGHHRHPRHRRALRRGPRARAARAPHRALPVAAVPRGRAVHRHAGRSTCRSPRPCARSARSSTASTTTCPSRRSSSRARSTTSSQRQGRAAAGARRTTSPRTRRRPRPRRRGRAGDDERRRRGRRRREGRRGGLLVARTPFKVEVLTPEGEVFNDEVEMVSTQTTRRLASASWPTTSRCWRCSTRPSCGSTSRESDVVRYAQGEGFLQVSGDARAVLVDEVVRGRRARRRRPPGPPAQRPRRSSSAPRRTPRRPARRRATSAATRRS